MATQWDYDLNLLMQDQQQTEWCWAAAATSVSLFYDSDSAWTQCKLANQQYAQTTCCDDGSTPACNPADGGFLEQALTTTGNYRPPVVAGPITIAQLEAEFAASPPRVVGVRIGWNQGGGHFVVISGASQADNIVHVRDPEPFWGTQEYDYTQFSTNYKGMGTWTHTMYTQPSAPVRAKPAKAPPAVVKLFQEAVARDANAEASANLGKKMNLSEAWQVYVEGLVDLADRKGLSAAILSGWQTVVTDPNGDLYTLEADGAVPEKITSLGRGSFTRQKLTMIHDAAQILAPATYTVRILRIPALRLNALWMKAAQDDADIVIPMPLVPAPLQSGKRYKRSEIEPILATMAQERLKCSNEPKT